MYSELRSVLRALARAPGYTATVILTLALGIGAAAGLYSMFARALFPRIPFRDPAQLVRLEKTGMGDGDALPLFQLSFFAYRQAKSFAAVSAFSYESASVLLNGDPEGIYAQKVTANGFAVLGVAPALGRTFLPDEGKPGMDDVVILSDWFWRNKMGADPAVVGKQLLVNARGLRIIGVLPASLEASPVFPGGQGIFIPSVLPGEVRDDEAFWAVFAYARLKPGVTAEQAQAELRTMHPEAGRPYADFMKRFQALVSPATQPTANVWMRRYRQMMWTGVAAVGCLYAIACVNAGSLMLVRTIGRRREIGIRLALGGGRWAVVRPLLWESLLLSLGAILLGALVAKWLLPLMLALAPGGDQRFSKGLTLDHGALGFLTGLGLLTGLAVVAGPAWRATRLNLNETVKEDSQAAGESRRTRRLRGLLVVVEAALAVVLLAGAGLMVRTFARLQETPTGYDVTHRYSVQIAAPMSAYQKPELMVERRRQILERLAAVPAVQGVGLAGTILPMYYGGQKVRVAGRTDIGAGGEVEGDGTPVSAEFMETLGVTLRAGRSFKSQRPSDPPVVVINETMARRYFGGRSPLGERLEGLGKDKWEIVGVVADLRSLRDGAKPRFYFPYWQQPGWAADQVLVRTAGKPGPKFQSDLRRAVYEVDPTYAVMFINPLDEVRDWEVWHEKFALMLLEVLASLAILLAVAGLFATMAYSVAQRRGEFGVRLALGATPPSIYRLVMEQGLLLAALGIGIGLAAAWVLSRYLESMLFGLPAHDPLTYGAVGLLMLLVAVPACWLPARWATRVDVAKLLRSE